METLVVDTPVKPILKKARKSEKSTDELKDTITFLTQIKSSGIVINGNIVPTITNDLSSFELEGHILELCGILKERTKKKYAN